jgi:crotonobetainyl-CoA:carnitine CoA-transferase CaiB-like acyl-CoA transferase
MSDELATAARRRARHDSIDGHLSEWCAERTGDQIVAALWDNGVPVGKVMQPHRQAELEQLTSRKFFEPVEHPINPVTRHSTMPFRFSRGPDRAHRTPAPLLGQHNQEVLRELGLTEDEISRLAADGVIGTAPAR